MNDSRYVLRERDREELARLELQHRVWKEETDAVVLRAGFKTGDRLLDIGCGPGYLTFDLAKVVGPEGSVLAVDTSEMFIGRLRSEAAERQVSQIQAEVVDAAEYEIPDAALDGAICRWVLMFLPNPGRAIDRVARALRPGGMLAVMEYVNFRSISLWPRAKSFDRLYEAVYGLIHNSGGDPDIGGRIPELARDAGLETVALLPYWRLGRPGSSLWKWLEAVNRNHANLVAEGLLTPTQLEEYERHWAERSADPAAFFTAPPVLVTLARKP
jgi:SAM-dependent methyltransferase